MFVYRVTLLERASEVGMFCGNGFLAGYEVLLSNVAAALITRGKLDSG